MSYNVVVPSKTPVEEFDITFPFQSQLEFGEFIAGYNVTITVSVGIDPAPTAVLMGSPTVSTMNVVQRVHAGVDGVTYSILVTVVGTDGGVYSKLCFLSVVSADAI